jgi:2',3'-cyclic-nucleotide 2'-phosphodiesterase (5'-nucleotidase family)
MAKAKSEKNQSTDGPITSDTVEPMVIALAEQLGTFLGRVQAKAEGWLENDALREQVGQIRDGAANLLKHVNSASTAARNAVMKPAPKKAKAKSTTAKGRSGGTVDAPGKRHRKPPPQESINKRMGEKTGKKAGQKQFSAGSRRGRG